MPNNYLCHLVLCQLGTPTRTIWEERTSTKKMPPSSWFFQYNIFFMMFSTPPTSLRCSLPSHSQNKTPWPFFLFLFRNKEERKLKKHTYTGIHTHKHIHTIHKNIKLEIVIRKKKASRRKKCQSKAIWLMWDGSAFCR